MLTMPTRTRLTNSMLGYPDDARLLIINADDFGMCHSVNAAVFHALKTGVVQSTSLMMPAPWGRKAAKLLRDNPDIDFGVHLTVISEMGDYGWGPLMSTAKVPSLLDSRGTFYDIKDLSLLLVQAKLSELQLEFRAQIETVLDYGLKPTHLDWHCLNNGGRDDIFDMTVGLAREYGLALRIHEPSYKRRLQSEALPASDHRMVDSYSVHPDCKAVRFADMLRELQPGVTEWAVHPGIGNGELKAIEPKSWQVRQTDYDFVVSPETRKIIEQEGITLIGYKPLQAHWRR